MVHNCIDWTATPPARKTPLLVLTRGDDRVYTICPKELKTLEQVARQEFNLGTDGDVTFLSPCANLCDGRPARITEASWEHLSTFIGCATVELSVSGSDHAEEGEEGRLSGGRSLKRKHPTDADDSEQDEPENATNRGETLADRGLRSVNQPKGLETPPPMDEVPEDVPSDIYGSSHDGGSGSSAAEDRRDDSLADQEASVVLPRSSRTRRRLLSHLDHTDDEGEAPEREPHFEEPAGSQAHSITSPSKASQQDGKDGPSHYLSQPQSSSADHPQLGLSQPIKQEKGLDETGHNNRPDSYNGSSLRAHTTESLLEIGTQPQVESNEYQKLMIRVAHRPSHHESKFTTKSTTKVAKVITSVCKSFGLDASHASLYLIVSTEDEDGEQENLFPCDKNDSISRAGADFNAESRFVLKIAGEP